MPKPRYSIAAIVRMYVSEYLTQKQIAERIGYTTRAVNRIFARHGIEARQRTSARVCWCGKPSEKIRYRRKDGVHVFSGALCHEHRMERNRRNKAEHERRKRDTC